MNKIFNFKEELAKYGLTEESYENCLKDSSDKVLKTSDLDWQDIIEKYNIPLHYDTLRKSQQPSPFGGAFIREYYINKMLSKDSDDNYFKELDIKKQEIKNEVYKLQTLNIEKNRIDRQFSRYELYNQQIGNKITTLPLPEFYPIRRSLGIKKEYLLSIADIHAGAKFTSENNSYSMDICKERFEKLAGDVIDFITEKQLSKLKVLELGDTIQGILRISDLKLNESSVVEATVFIARVIAQFLNEISAYCEIEYYHVPTANHSQTRNLGTKSSELASEDVEYVISNYIKDLLSNNQRVNVVLSNKKEYINVPILDFNTIAMHGHQIRNVKDSLRDLSVLHRVFYDFVFLAHYHGGAETIAGESIVGDTEVLVCPSFIGSDPYSDSIMRGSKAACKIFGFDYYKGHTETYKIILN